MVVDCVENCEHEQRSNTTCSCCWFMRWLLLYDLLWLWDLSSVSLVASQSSRFAVRIIKLACRNRSRRNRSWSVADKTFCVTRGAERGRSTSTLGAAPSELCTVLRRSSLSTAIDHRPSIANRSIDTIDHEDCDAVMDNGRRSHKNQRYVFR
jgi:hypothetical protein